MPKILTGERRPSASKMETVIPIVNTVWPIMIAFVGLVIVLAKMHVSIQTLQEKVKVLFDLHNQKKD